jgi:hypothetical protein
VARLGFADRDDLVQWGRAQGAAADLPRLIRRLILETAPDLVSLGFAAGVGVYGSAWDGSVRANAATVRVPGGLSLWELSTRGDVNRKADDDYSKRTETPDGTPTEDAAYVAVSARTWQDREDWARGKAEEGRWREVRAYGVDDLESWLEDAPVTWAWISELLGLQPHGLVTAQGWWESWSRATEPAFPAKAILAGRDSIVEALRTTLAGPGEVITIAGASREDVLAFVSAFAATEEDGGALLARSAFLDQVEAWRRWRDLRRPLLLAPLNDELRTAMTSGTEHHLIVPVVGDLADLDLPPIDAQAAAAALQEAGLDEERANEVGELARLTLLAGRRRIAVKPELHRPSWARPPVVRLVRRLILLGRFSENAINDRDIAGEVVGADYETVSENVEALTIGEDPLLARVSAALGVVSAVDAWLLVADQLRREDLEAFHAAAVKVLTESDPRQELAPEERWQAGVLGKRRAHSEDLRGGVATTLALMGTYGMAPIPGAGLTAREWASLIVQQILEAANVDQTGRLWASLDDVMPLLAEAAPDELLAAVRTGLGGDDPLLAKLFTDHEGADAFFVGTSHSGLLWALENCSWSPDHFGAVVDLVARWGAVDPGGRYVNRPKATLTELFRAWYPQTSVTAERRLDVIDTVRTRHPEVAWPLLLSLLPEMHGVAMPIHAPRFRDWKKRDEPKTRAEVLSFYEAIFARALEDAGADPERLVPLVDNLPTLPSECRAALVARLDEIRGGLEEGERDCLWTAIRAEAARNRSYASAEWALPEADVVELERLSAHYQPNAATTRGRWLFVNDLVDIAGADPGDDYDAYEEALGKARAETARAIADEAGWNEIYGFARTLEVVWFFGTALAAAGVHAYEPELLVLLERDDLTDVNLALSYFGQRFREEGWPWLEAQLQTELTARQRARLLLASADYPAAWEHLPDDEVARAFWSEFRVQGLGRDFPHIEHVARELFAVERYGAGLDLLNLYLREDTGPKRAGIVADGLEQLVTRGTADEVRQLSRYGLRKLFNYLERAGLDEDRLAQLEWAYLPAFSLEPAPPTLSRALATNPAFFVEVISWVFRPGDDDEAESGDEAQPEPDEQTVAVARNAYRLLSDWRTLPGQQADGGVDGDQLRTWVEQARAGLREARRLRVGDGFIGKILAASPADPDGAWPCLAVRELLEALQSPEIERGMRTEIFNSVGVTSRGVLQGGDQERAGAEVPA